LIFVKIAISSAYRSLVPSLFILGWGLSFLYLTKGMVPLVFSPFKILLVYCLTALFYGFFGLIAASFMPTVSDVRHLWMRFLMPLWWLGGFNYNWKTVYSVAPKFALFTLLDPVVYIMEAVRSSVLGPENFLPFWPSIGMIILYTIIFGIIAVKRLKVRLDCL
jgi:ABC-type polysaccharide/polyol phosphate export permease